MTDIVNIKAYVPDVNVAELIPFLLLLVGGIACLAVDAVSDRKSSRRYLPLIGGVALACSFISFFLGGMAKGPFVEGSFIADSFGQMACLVIVFATFVQTIFGPRLVKERNIPSGEFYTLILFVAFGGCLLAMANEMLTAFISLEIMSISLYVLTGIDRRCRKSVEAGFKYFILGAFSSAFLVLGMAFLFGATHSTRFDVMAQNLMEMGSDVQAIWLFVGFALVMVGICFKLSLAPFHMWAPDVYEGANTPTTMVIATASKVAAMGFLLHLVVALGHWPAFGSAIAFMLGLVAVASILWGNLAALVQTNFKRMMAFSSVAHTGYMMVAVMVLAALPGLVDPSALGAAQSLIYQAIILYLAGYTLMNILAFGIAWHIGGTGNMAAYRGLCYRNPLAATGMVLAMFSLAGLGFAPPTIGFMGKFYLFKEVINHGFIGIAVIAMIGSAISAFYYLGLVVTMFMREQSDESSVAVIGAPRKGTLISETVFTRAILCAVGVMIFVFGIWPELFLGIGHTLMVGLGR